MTGHAIIDAAAVPDAFRTTGTSPTLHLLGPGAVGRALLERVADSNVRLTGVTDTSGTIHDARGLDARDVARWKQLGRPLALHPAAFRATSPACIGEIDADTVVDATATELGRTQWSAALAAALARGRTLALASKGALCDHGAEWLTGPHADRVGCNAVLGGTGRAFVSALTELRQRVRRVTIVGNASTTSIIQSLENGASFEEALRGAQRLGYLEPDPELDLRGFDAAVKLAIVAGALTGTRIDPRTIPCADIRSIDPRLLRGRARNGSTTRLIARLHDDRSLRVAYEEVAGDSILAVPPGRVVYEYGLDRDERRLHVGTGLGADATAAALWGDVSALTRVAAGAR